MAGIHQSADQSVPAVPSEGRLREESGLIRSTTSFHSTPLLSGLPRSPVHPVKRSRDRSSAAAGRWRWVLCILMKNRRESYPSTRTQRKTLVVYLSIERFVSLHQHGVLLQLAEDALRRPVPVPPQHRVKQIQHDSGAWLPPNACTLQTREKKTIDPRR